MAGKGALSSLARLFEGYSLPAAKMTPNRANLLSRYALPDEQLLYHGSESPFYDIHNLENFAGGKDPVGLFTAPTLHLPNMFAGDEGYITPFVIPRDQVAYSGVKDRRGFPVIHSGDVHPEVLGYDTKSPLPVFPEYWAKYQQTLTPLLRRILGDRYAHGGLI